jgi:hypothetical protein
MPASNQTTAQRQAEAKRRAEAAAKRNKKPKPSGRTKADLMGGAPPRSNSVPVTPDSRRDPEFSRSRGGVGDTKPIAGARQANLPQFRSPAIGAPVHARPQAFGAATQARNGTLSAQPSVYAPQAGQAPRPNTPQPSAAPQPQAPANPFQAIGNIQGQAIPEGGAGLQQQPVQAVTQEYGGQQVQGVGADGVDMERRRAFLDADNSLDGLKAVKELLNRRKLSIAVEN